MTDPIRKVLRVIDAVLEREGIITTETLDHVSPEYTKEPLAAVPDSCLPSRQPPNPTQE